jgi:soluble cytochrome b562
MRLLIAVLFLGFALSASAMSLKDFNATPDKEQSAYVATFIDKMTTDLRAQNTQLAQAVRTWFARKMDGKPLSEGMERLYVELAALESLAQDGKVDLSKIQIEGVIVKVVKDKFPPPAR